MNIAELKKIFEKEYISSDWKNALQEIFHIKDLHIIPNKVDLTENIFGATAFELGFFETSEGLLVGLYEVNISTNKRLERNKVGLRNLMRNVYTKDADAALIVFNQGDTWRFTYVSELTTIDKETGKRELRQTDPKRYTYILGKNQFCRTAAERFASLKTNTDIFDTHISIKEIEKAFSVDTLTKDFYHELSNWYFWALTKVNFPAVSESSDEINNATSLIRLITRLIFVWFMKQKGLISNELFDKEAIDKLLNYSDSTGSTYYKAILQNLFFATLNTPLKDDNRSFVHRQTGKQDYYRYQRYFKNKELFLELTRDIPFLNGGLFENLDKRTAKGDPTDIFIDCFTNLQSNETLLAVPDELFFVGAKDVDLSELYDDEKQKHLKVKGIIDILHSYNFTVEENTPLDIQIALDPEMLGRVFENLLASYNPETKTTARKQTGSFYTPREIVNYMIDESLIACLNQKLSNISEKETDAKNNETKLRELLSYSRTDNPFDESETKILVQAIDSIKVLDPACGSGAFPMGILQQLVHVLQKLDQDNLQWKQLQMQRAQAKLKSVMENGDANHFASQLKEIADNFSTDAQDYGRKLYLIENCIYGIDIQPIAVQIAKLRFFISLLCEQDVIPNEVNRGIKSLPNMDFKIVAANTLITAPKNDAIDAYANDALEQFDKFTTEYFYASIQEKPKLKNRIKICTNEILNANHKVINQWVDKIKREKNSATGAKLKIMNYQLQQFQEDLDHWDTFENMFKNESVAFFETKYFFPHVKDGFDIVIGNPPYISIQRLNPEAKNQLQRIKYNSFENTGDIYALFYERGQQLLKTNGILSYITSRQWMQASYGKSLRRFLTKETNPLQLIDFGQVKIFEGATVFVNILLFEKNINQSNLLACLIPTDYNVEHGNLTAFIEANNQRIAKLTENTWAITKSKDINEQIEKIGKPLFKWGKIIFNRGITSGLNDAFHIELPTKIDLINQDPKNAEIIKPLLRGKDIKRYGYDFENWYILNTHNGVREVGLQSIDVIKDYPKVYEHLQQWQSQLEERLDKGGHWTNLRNCAFLLEFEKPKIVWIEISDRANYAYDDRGMYLTNSAYFLTCDCDQVSLKYLLAVLNSKVADFYFSQKTARIAGGRMRYTKQYVEQIPVPEISLTEQKPFIVLVNFILFLKNQRLTDSTDKIMPFFFEHVIDVAVAELFFKEEINIAGFEIIKYLQYLPESEDSITLDLIRKTYTEFNNPNHPIRNAVSLLKNHEPFKTIEETLNRKN
ncbi:MAG: Eco57I restriction-modification methylase domain-containing protein [Bacteroidia bacterium]|nr:Eco57I restriction-modification methylase domain-containing protein [Bacteroidia bacterium]